MSQSCNDGWQMYKKAGGFKGLARRLTFFPANTSAPMKQICERPPVSVIDLSGIGYGFRGNNGRVWTYLSFQFQMKKKEREICETEMHFKRSFCSRSNLSRWHNFCKERGRPGLKTGMDFRRVYILPFLVWNCVGFSRELRECMNVFASFHSKWIRKRNMRIWNEF